MFKCFFFRHEFKNISIIDIVDYCLEDRIVSFRKALVNQECIKCGKKRKVWVKGSRL